MHNSGASRGGNGKVYPHVIARSKATKQPILLRGKMECFAAFAMTMLGLFEN
jgi:hypothetical protein